MDCKRILDCFHFPLVIQPTLENKHSAKVQSVHSFPESVPHHVYFPRKVSSILLHPPSTSSPNPHVQAVLVLVSPVFPRVQFPLGPDVNLYVQVQVS